MRVEKIAENVDFRVVMLRREFRAGNELDQYRGARRRRARAALHCVVVGQRDARQAVFLRLQDEFFRREGSVGETRVQM